MLVRWELVRSNDEKLDGKSCHRKRVQKKVYDDHWAHSMVLLVYVPKAKSQDHKGDPVRAMAVVKNGKKGRAKEDWNGGLQKVSGVSGGCEKR